MEPLSINHSISSPPVNIPRVQPIQIPTGGAASMAARPVAATGTGATFIPGGSPPNFDFGKECQPFRSTFARYLSLTSDNFQSCWSPSTSADFDYKRFLRYFEDEPDSLPSSPKRTASPNGVNSINGGNEAANGVARSTTSPPPPALPARRITNNSSGNRHCEAFALISYELEHMKPYRMSLGSLSSSSSSSSNSNKVINQQQQQQQQQQQMLPGNNTNNVVNNNLSQHRNPQQQQAQQNGCPVWPRDRQQVGNTKENKRHNDKNIDPSRPASEFELQEDTCNVEAVILQNQVDTLQWQLKQVDTSCEMYRSVMEEVSRFLERYTSQTVERQQQQQQQQNRSEQQIARSKSLHHVHAASTGNGTNNIASNKNGKHESMVNGGESLSNSYSRTRSSSNLVTNAAAAANNSILAMSDEHNYETVGAAGSYNAFKDFTMRRAPKKPTGRNATASLCPEDAEEEKLNQEAFRLLRTIHNLLNTYQHQPDLTITQRNSLAGAHSRLGKAASASIMTLPAANSTVLGGGASNADSNIPKPRLVNGATSNINNASATVTSSTTSGLNDMMFLRSSNIRDSRISLRSSTDSSVHSTMSSAASSSSKIETDEEVTHANASFARKRNRGSGDESGFSSISSFHDIGLPTSNVFSSSTPRPSLETTSQQLPSIVNNLADDLNSTLKASTASLPVGGAATHPTNISGLPHSNSANASPSKTYRNATKCQRFSTLSNEDSAPVLWV